MRHRLSVALLFVALALASPSAADLDPRVAARDATVDGQRWDDLVNAWWQWAASMTRERSPIHDRTGARCHEGQSGGVWFLAGGYGSASIQRTCRVPRDVYLFFPIINAVSYPRVENGQTCLTSRRVAARENSALVDLIITLDGQPIPRIQAHRVVSPVCFDMLARVPEKYDPPRVYPAATDGYWLMLKPLPEGTHTLQFAAQYAEGTGNLGGMLQDIYHILTVE